MTSLTIDEQLPDYEVAAFNFAEASDNKIHSDETAGDYGFRGGLVPGVAVYAYMTVPVVKALGRDWIEKGDMTGKFIKPIYDGETVTVKARVAAVDPMRIILTVLNSGGTLCAVGEASYPESPGTIDLTPYGLTPPPPVEQRLPADLEHLPDGTPLGALVYKLNLQEVQELFVPIVRDPLPIYQNEDVWHPAYLAHEANRMLMENIALGPWIHTASDVDHHALPEDGETINVMGRIVHPYTKRGHQIIVADIVFTGHMDRVLAHMSHTAIVKPFKGTF